MAAISKKPLKASQLFFPEGFSGIPGAKTVRLDGTVAKTLKVVRVHGVEWGHSVDKLDDSPRAKAVPTVHLQISPVDPEHPERPGKHITLILTTNDAHSLGLGLVDMARVSDQKFSGKLG